MGIAPTRVILIGWLSMTGLFKVHCRLISYICNCNTNRSIDNAEAVKIAYSLNVCWWQNVGPLYNLKY